MLRTKREVQPFIQEDRPNYDYQARDCVCGDEALRRKGRSQRHACTQRLENEGKDNARARIEAVGQGPAARMERFEFGAEMHAYRTRLPLETQFEGAAQLLQEEQREISGSGVHLPAGSGEGPRRRRELRDGARESYCFG